jgi:hypothetical protein
MSQPCNLRIADAGIFDGDRSEAGMAFLPEIIIFA